MSNTKACKKWEKFEFYSSHHVSMSCKVRKQHKYRAVITPEVKGDVITSTLFSYNQPIAALVAINGNKPFCLRLTDVWFSSTTRRHINISYSYGREFPYCGVRHLSEDPIDLLACLRSNIDALVSSKKDCMRDRNSFSWIEIDKRRLGENYHSLLEFITRLGLTRFDSPFYREPMASVCRDLLCLGEYKPGKDLYLPIAPLLECSERMYDLCGANLK